MYNFCKMYAECQMSILKMLRHYCCPMEKPKPCEPAPLLRATSTRTASVLVSRIAILWKNGLLLGGAC